MKRRMRALCAVPLRVPPLALWIICRFMSGGVHMMRRITALRAVPLPVPPEALRIICSFLPGGY